MFHWIGTHPLLIAIVACAAFATWKGGWPERIGAGVNLLVALLVFISVRTFSVGALTTVTLVLDGFLAFSFLALAVRFAAVWMGLAMLLQAGQFALHAYYYVAERPFDPLFAIVNNVVSWGVILCITGGVLASWARGSRARPASLSAASAG